MTFDHFLLDDIAGSSFRAKAPNLAARIYRDNIRVLIHDLTPKQSEEVHMILNRAYSAPPSPGGTKLKSLFEVLWRGRGAAVMAGATEPQPLRRWADVPSSLMRIVLSRKGVDSGSGRIASPILGDWLISLPIPGASQITYADLRFRDIFDCDAGQGGELGKGFIDVHHIRPLNQIREGYAVDPKQDLIPVCPNCHAILHQIEPPLSIPDLQRRLRRPYG